MKKFYAIALACSIAASASADISVEDVCGNYEWTYQSEVAFDIGKRIVPITIEPGNSPKTVLIKGMYIDYNFVADLDPKAETISLRSQTVDIDMSLGAFYIYNVSKDDEGEYVAERKPIVGHFVDGQIIFPEDEMIGIGYPELGSYFVLASGNSFAPGVDRYFVFNDDEWSSVGTGKFVDGWLIYHFLGLDDHSVEYDVEYMVNKENKNLYCIMNPYDNKVWKAYNADKEAKGHIVFDISNPEFVTLRTYVYSGFTDPDKGNGKLYMYSTDSHLHFIDGYPYDEMPESILSTYKDGIVTIPSPAFGNESHPVGHYGWGKEYSKFILPANGSGSLDEIVSVQDMPIEYYDMQGRKVINPANGIFIRRQGSSTSKIIR